MSTPHPTVARITRVFEHSTVGLNHVIDRLKHSLEVNTRALTQHRAFLNHDFNVTNYSLQQAESLRDLEQSINDKMSLLTKFDYQKYNVGTDLREPIPAFPSATPVLSAASSTPATRAARTAIADALIARAGPSAHAFTPLTIHAFPRDAAIAPPDFSGGNASLRAFMRTAPPYTDMLDDACGPRYSSLRAAPPADDAPLVGPRRKLLFPGLRKRAGKVRTAEEMLAARRRQWAAGTQRVRAAFRLKDPKLKKKARAFAPPQGAKQQPQGKGVRFVVTAIPLNRRPKAGRAGRVGIGMMCRPTPEEDLPDEAEMEVVEEAAVERLLAAMAEADGMEVPERGRSLIRGERYVSPAETWERSPSRHTKPVLPPASPRPEERRSTRSWVGSMIVPESPEALPESSLSEKAAGKKRARVDDEESAETTGAPTLTAERPVKRLRTRAAE